MEKKENVRNRITSILTRRFAEHELEANPLGEAKEVFRIEHETIDEIVLYIESLLTTPSVRGEELTEGEKMFLRNVVGWGYDFSHWEGGLVMPDIKNARRNVIKKLKLSPQTTEGEEDAQADAEQEAVEQFAKSAN